MQTQTPVEPYANVMKVASQRQEAHPKSMYKIDLERRNPRAAQDGITKM